MKTTYSYRPLQKHRNSFAFLHSKLKLVVFFLFLAVYGQSQEESTYDEVAVPLNVDRVGTTEMNIIIKNQEAYLPVKALFDYLKIKNTLSGNLDSVTGFFINPKAPYIIDKKNNRIEYQDKIINITPTDMMLTETGLYLKSGIFGQLFGLDCDFNFRNLSIRLKTRMELPAIREWQQELLRKNISHLVGEKKPDTTIGKKFYLAHPGVADWALTAIQETNRKNYTRANVIVGAILLGGEADLNFNYYIGQPFDSRQQFYRWRYVNNNHRAIKQITAGRIATRSIASIFAPVNGIQITNTPSTFRKSFGTYRYTGTTEPEWMVELYVNSILVNYARADASGFFAFEIPVVYGNSSIRLKFFGPWGEEITKEENINIPYNFLPRQQFEYLFSTGFVEDGKASRFARADFNYGLTRRLTIGAGAEYLSSVMSGKPMPFMNASLRVGSALILNGEYTYGIRSKGTLNYRRPSNLQIDLSYTKYQKDQTAIWYNYLEERKASLSMPLHLQKLTAFTRLSFNQVILKKSQFSNIEWLLSTVVAGVSSSFKTTVQYNNPATKSIYSSLSLSFRLPHGLRFTPLAQYQFSQKNFSQLKGELEKRISDRGFMSLSWENNRQMRNTSLTLGFRYNFSFAQTFFSARTGNGTTQTTQSAKGSLMFDNKADLIDLNNRANVGKGGLMVTPFLDINNNGRHDAFEPKAFGLNVRVNGGRIQRNDNDTSLLITGLEANTDYFIELDKNSFDNIAWQIKKPTIKVLVEPNLIKIIDVPVMVAGEASGIVYLQKGGQQKGLSRIIVNFYNSSSIRVAQTLTETDGYFSYLGLPPGNYTIRVDTGQLHNLNLISLQKDISFFMAGNAEGSIADGFEFVLTSVSPIKDQAAATYEKTLPSLQQNPKSKTLLRQSAVQDSPETNNPLKKEEKELKTNRSVVVKKKPAIRDVKETPKQKQNDSNEKKQTSIIKKDGRSGEKNEIQKKTSKKANPVIIKKIQTPVNPPKNNLPAKKQESNTRSKLLQDYNKADKRHQEASIKLDHLLKERQLLIEKNLQLIHEIKELRRKLQQQRLNKKHPLDKKSPAGQPDGKNQ